MIQYIINRIIFIIIALLIASVLIFIITEIIPGDVAQMILGQNATKDALHALREKLGLYRPAHIRYFEWITGILHGDLGTSLTLPGVSVSWLIVRRGRNSLFLAGTATILLVPISLTLGVIAGLKNEKWQDNLISILTLIAISLPEFVSGIFLMLIFSVWFRVLPSSSAIDPDANLFNQFKLMILPIVTVSLVIIGYVVRMLRASVIEASRADYTRTAILKGLSRFTIITRHVLKNALLPTITIIAMNIGWLIGGIIITETVFGFPGLGRLVLFAIKQRDVPLIQSSILVMSAVFLIFNLIADLIYAWLNPKIRY